LQYSFKENKLNTNQYTYVFNNVKYKVFSDCFTVLITDSNKKPGFGVIVPKKNVKLSSKRNLCKRVVREFYRKIYCTDLFNQKHIIFIANRNAKNIDKYRLWKSLENFLKQSQIQLK
jgi:ribonuclease P protein component